MIRSFLAVAALAVVPVLAHAQSASAPLMVTATVISTCKVATPGAGDPARFATLPVSVTCARGGAAPRVQRPSAPRRSEMRDAVLVIDF